MWERSEEEYIRSGRRGPVRSSCLGKGWVLEELGGLTVSHWGYRLQNSTVLKGRFKEYDQTRFIRAWMRANVSSGFFLGSPLPCGFPRSPAPGSFLLTINQRSTTTTTIEISNLVKASKTLVVDHFEDLLSRWSLMESFFLSKATTWAWCFTELNFCSITVAM